FLRGAVAAFTTALISRMNRIIDRSQALNARLCCNSRAPWSGSISNFRQIAAIANFLLRMVGGAKRCACSVYANGPGYIAHPLDLVARRSPALCGGQRPRMAGRQGIWLIALSQSPLAMRVLGVGGAARLLFARTFAFHDIALLIPLILKLAARNLLYDKLRFAATVLGIVFSIVLATVQLGLFVSFERTVTVMIDHAPADLWIVPLGTKCFED